MGFNTVPFNPFPPSSDQQGSGGGGSSYVLPAATDETLGGVKVGDNLTIEEDGTLNAADPYTLPIAADDTLGGVKVGSGLSIDSETGALSADSQMVDYSTTEQATGQKWIDGKDIYRKVIANVADQATIATDVDTIVNCIIARHGTSSDSNRHVFGDGFTVNDGGSILLDTTTHSATYAVWASTGGSLDKAADHIIIEYTKVETEG